VRFDDRLITVLAQPVANPHDRAVRWRQLVELLARAPDLSSVLSQRALDEIRSQRSDIDEQLRAAAARAIARPQLPVQLLAVFAADRIAVSAPVLAAASLQPSQWKDVLAGASLESRRFVHSLYPDLPAWGAPPLPPEPAAPEPEPQQAPQPEPEAAPTPAAPSGPAAPIPSISEVLARIESIRQERQRTQPEVQAAAQRQAPPGASPLFRWECGPSGEIAWVEGVPRGALIGRSLASPGEHNGVDQRIQRAFAVRAPFRDAVLTISGEGTASGEWMLSGVPAFEPSDGRFAGYRGVGVRASAAEQHVITPEPFEEEPLDEDALRELIHELRTPLNAIIGFAEIIDGQYLGPADQPYRARAAEIVEQAQMLLSAIEDLDTAARIRASVGEGDLASDLNALLTSLAPELKDRAARRGSRVDLLLSRTPAICTIDPGIFERLLKRFCFALIDVAVPREKLSISVECDVGQCLVSVTRPQELRGIADSQIFGRDGEEPNVLASGFSLKLARGIAQTAGGDLRVSGDKLALVLPRRTP
jgi:hypothetical protein